jgi:DNA-binding MarR family transcriptional regulator
MAARKSRRARPAAPAETREPPSRDPIEQAFAESGYDLVAHAGHVIRRAHQRATARFQEVMAGHDLTPTQMAALATVLRHGALSQNQLGRLTAMDPSTISIVVRKLVKAGLAECSVSEADMRLSIIRLTDKGTRYTLSVLPRGVEVSRRVLAPLSPREREVFMALLHRVADGDEPETFVS